MGKCPRCKATIQVPNQAPAAPPEPEPLQPVFEPEPALFEPEPVSTYKPPAKRKAEPRAPAGAFGLATLIAWIGVGILGLCLGIVVVLHVGLRTDAAASNDRLAAAEKDIKTAKAMQAEQANQLTTTQQRLQETEQALSDSKRASGSANDKLTAATKDLEAARNESTKLKSDLEAAEKGRSAAEKSLAEETKKRGADSGELQTLKKDLAAAQAKLKSNQNEISRLQKDLEEAEKTGPFAAYAGNWKSKETTGDSSTVSISVRGGGSGSAATVTPTNQPGVANFTFSRLKLVMKDGKCLLDDSLLGRNWELVRGKDADTLTLVELGGGKGTFNLVREKPPAPK